MSALTDSATLVPLTRGLFAIVDAADFEWVSQWKWYAVGRPGAYYAVRTERSNGKQWAVRLHRELLKPKPDEQVDHINRNTLDNRRGNLRLATSAQNGANRAYRVARSGFRGVHAQKSGRWKATLCCGYQRLCAGTYDTAVEAARAYDALALTKFGEFANLNFPDARLTEHRRRGND